MRIIVRVYVAGVKQSEERIEMDAEMLGELLPKLAERHGDMMAVQPGMVEIEFPDEPDLSQRFFRIGTDPSGMVLPVKIR
jgi:hypothetical protein